MFKNVLKIIAIHSFSNQDFLATKLDSSLSSSYFVIIELKMLSVSKWNNPSCQLSPLIRGGVMRVLECWKCWSVGTSATISSISQH